jgi:hypothetical protein
LSSARRSLTLGLGEQEASRAFDLPRVVPFVRIGEAEKMRYVVEDKKEPLRAVEFDHPPNRFFVACDDLVENPLRKLADFELPKLVSLSPLVLGIGESPRVRQIVGDRFNVIRLVGRHAASLDRAPVARQ